MKLVCGRTDCEYEFRGQCQLGTISIGKDCRCQNYKVCSDVEEAKLFQKSVDNMIQDNRCLNEKKVNT